MNLSSEAIAGIADKLESADIVDVAPEPVVEAAPAEEPAQADTSSEPTEDVNAQVEDGAATAPEEVPSVDSTEDDFQEPPGHRVPYDRFKQVLESRNQFRDERATLEAELSKLREQATTPAPAPVQAAPQTTSDDDWLEKYLAGEDEPSTPSVDPQLSELRERIKQTEVQLASQALDVEVGLAIEKFPTVPRDVILQAVATNPGATALAVAEQYTSWVAGIEEQAISAYLKENPSKTIENSSVDSADAEPKAAPRPSKNGGTVATAAAETGPRSISEGSAALRKLWARNNPFAG